AGAGAGRPGAGGRPRMTRLLVATLNILNLADRWEERLPLLLADTAALRPDLLGLQEVVYPMQQDRLLAAGTPDEYAIYRGWAGRPEYGNSLLVRAPLAAVGMERLDLGHQRAVHRVTVTLPGGVSLVVAVTHLHHRVPDAALRDEQTAELVAWIDAAAASDAQVVMGDFNADPAEPAYERMVRAGFRSAYAEANGAEPGVTWPSGLQAPAMDTDGDPSCLDYIWLRGRARAADSLLWADRPAAQDATLYPSDHLGVVATVTIG
ncbi:MAG: endonuclease/exonuclease/phosphatase family protein, partial [Chloroflexota bacterium]